VKVTRMPPDSTGTIRPSATLFTPGNMAILDRTASKNARPRSSE
jgi:hypothetical protein